MGLLEDVEATFARGWNKQSTEAKIILGTAIASPFIVATAGYGLGLLGVGVAETGVVGITSEGVAVTAASSAAGVGTGAAIAGTGTLAGVAIATIPQAIKTGGTLGIAAMALDYMQKNPMIVIAGIGAGLVFMFLRSKK